MLRNKNISFHLKPVETFYFRKVNLQQHNFLMFIRGRDYLCLDVVYEYIPLGWTSP